VIEKVSEPLLRNGISPGHHIEQKPPTRRPRFRC
jgi:hypothetical protein